MLTIAFVLLGEVLIYVPSIARFRKVYLDERIAAAHLATLSLEARRRRAASRARSRTSCLSHAGVLSVTLREPAPELMLGQLPPVEKVLDLRAGGALALIGEAFETLRHGGRRIDPRDRPLAAAPGRAGRHQPARGRACGTPWSTTPGASSRSRS